MMTTKIFQRVLVTFLVVAAIFLANGLNNVANAARVQIYDGSVNNILNDIKDMNEFTKNHSDELRKRIKNYNEFENLDLDFSIRGTHYYTGKDGFRYCESYFGDSDRNRLVFKVNNDGAVSSAWIIFPLYTLAGELNEKGSGISGFLLGSVVTVSGLNDDEYFNIWNQAQIWFNNLKTGQQLNKTFSIWCTKSKRYIDVNFFRDDSDDTLNFHIFAHT